jgi:putative ABC transport system permease protein
LRESLRETIDQVAGKAVLQVTAGGAGIPEAVLDEVRSIPGIRAAVPIIEEVVRTTDTSQGNILILGVDMAGDQSMRDYEMEASEDAVSDPLTFLAQPDSIILSKEFASRNGLSEGSRMNLVTSLGARAFTVRGIMTPKGMAKAFGGNVGVMDIYSAQFFFGFAKTSLPRPILNSISEANSARPFDGMTGKRFRIYGPRTLSR